MFNYTLDNDNAQRKSQKITVIKEDFNAKVEKKRDGKIVDKFALGTWRKGDSIMYGKRLSNIQYLVSITPNTFMDMEKAWRRNEEKKAAA